MPSYNWRMLHPRYSPHSSATGNSTAPYRRQPPRTWRPGQRPQSGCLAVPRSWGPPQLRLPSASPHRWSHSRQNCLPPPETCNRCLHPWLPASYNWPPSHPRCSPHFSATGNSAAQYRRRSPRTSLPGQRPQSGCLAVPRSWGPPQLRLPSASPHCSSHSPQNCLPPPETWNRYLHS